MAIVITDGKYYFKPGNKYARTQNTEEAATFPKREDAIQFMWADVDETKFLYVYVRKHKKIYGSGSAGKKLRR